jgi:hypothetical protein
MGLDQYAYARKPNSDDQVELAYWRKHPSLQGWMANLWVSRCPGQIEVDDFNCVELELFWDDLTALEIAIRDRQLPLTHGFFFGSGNDEQYRERDLKFITDAKAELFLGLRVFYSPSW